MELQVQETTKVNTVNTLSLVQKLQIEAAQNPVFNSICHIFALRERARQQVTINSLLATTKREGFDYTKDQLKEVISTLANLGIGRLDKATNGRVRALKDIQVTLQSIGQAAVSKTGDLKRYHKTPKFKKLAVKPETVAIPKSDIATQSVAKSKVEIKAKPLSYPVIVSTKVKGRDVTFHITEGLTLQELTEMLEKLG